LRIESPPLRVLGVLLLVLASGRLLLADSIQPHADSFVPLFNAYALPALTVAACVLAAAEASRRFLGPHPGLLNRILQVCLGIGGVLLVWFIVSVEVYDYASGWGWLAGQTALSASWAVCAVAVLAVGLGVGSEPLRWTALGLFGLSLAKLVLYDMAELGELYRVVVFLGLAITMAAGAWAYQKYLLPLRTTSEGMG
jgi:uncharacterized membrane protein